MATFCPDSLSRAELEKYNKQTNIGVKSKSARESSTHSPDHPVGSLTDIRESRVAWGDIKRLTTNYLGRRFHERGHRLTTLEQSFTLEDHIRPWRI